MISIIRSLASCSSLCSDTSVSLVVSVAVKPCAFFLIYSSIALSFAESDTELPICEQASSDSGDQLTPIAGLPDGVTGGSSNVLWPEYRLRLWPPKKYFPLVLDGMKPISPSTILPNICSPVTGLPQI